MNSDFVLLASTTATPNTLLGGGGWLQDPEKLREYVRWGGGLGKMCDSCDRQGSGQVLLCFFLASSPPLPLPKVDKAQELAQLKNLMEIKHERRVEA